LVFSHLRYVVSVARGFVGYGLPMADLVSEGTVGLMKAVKRFDPSHGVRLVTFAMYWVKSEICDYISRNMSLVRVATTRKKAKLLRVLSKIKGEQHSGNLTYTQRTELANEFSINPKEVDRLSNHINNRDVSIDQQDFDWSCGTLATATKYEEQEWQNKRNQSLQYALSQLDDRERTIGRGRWLSEDKTTLQDLAVEFGVSLERIRQIEVSALAKLRNMLPKQLSDGGDLS
jgi:RNA polymerase sigma-32 factor